MEDRLANAVRTFTADGAHSRQNLSALVGRGFSAALVRHMSQSLTLPEVSTVLLAERSRETGLARARAGDLAAAAPLIVEGRSIRDQGDLGDEACCVADAFQLAAESYLDYRRGGLVEARAALDESIALTVRLAREFGYRMGYRVIHLARNIVHAESLLGAKESALDEAVALSRFVGGERGAWRYAALGEWEPVAELDAHEQLLACDDALGELALAADWQPARLDRAWIDVARIPPLVGEWLGALRACACGDAAAFLDLVVRQCTTGEVSMPQARLTMGDGLRRLCERTGRPELLAELGRPG